MAVTASRAAFRYSHTVGYYAMAGRGFSNPVDLAQDSAGALYVLSRGNPAQAIVAIGNAPTALLALCQQMQDQQQQLQQQQDEGRLEGEGRSPDGARAAEDVPEPLEDHRVDGSEEEGDAVGPGDVAELDDGEEVVLGVAEEVPGEAAHQVSAEELQGGPHDRHRHHERDSAAVESPQD